MLRKILIAVDGSMHSKGALAYVASVFKQSPEVQFTLFNVQPIISQYLLEEAGIHSSQVEQLTVPRTGRIAKMILEKVQAGDYDTVIVGRRGSGNAFFFGNVSHYVIERLTDRAVWLIG